VLEDLPKFIVIFIGSDVVLERLHGFHVLHALRVRVRTHDGVDLRKTVLGLLNLIECLAFVEHEQLLLEFAELVLLLLEAVGVGHFERSFEGVQPVLVDQDQLLVELLCAVPEGLVLQD